ncbi:hypothetical protein LCGC14_2737480, partial [marine sediment metagenome]
IELSDTNKQSEYLTEFELNLSKFTIEKAQKSLRNILKKLNKKVQITIPYKNGLMKLCFNHLVPYAHIEHEKFLQLNKKDKNKIR